MTRRAPTATLFPYTTLFRSHRIEMPVRRGRDRREIGEFRRPDRVGPEADHVIGQPDRMIAAGIEAFEDRKSTRLNSSHVEISYAVFCLKKKMNKVVSPVPET